MWEHHLIVKTAVVGSQIEITMQDTGTGIPGEDLLKIFEPLYSTKGFGVGLGLALAKQVIGQHKGKISVTRKLGAGTNVVLRLPLTLASTRTLPSDEVAAGRGLVRLGAVAHQEALVVLQPPQRCPGNSPTCMGNPGSGDNGKARWPLRPN